MSEEAEKAKGEKQEVEDANREIEELEEGGERRRAAQCGATSPSGGSSGRPAATHASSPPARL